MVFISTTTIWFVKTWNATEVLRSFLYIGRFPLNSFSFSLRVFFSVFIPIAFITTIPSEVFLGIFFTLALIIILCDIALKLGSISKRYEVELNCRLLSLEKSATIFKKLSRLPNLKSKQRIWDFCREVIK